MNWTGTKMKTARVYLVTSGNDRIKYIFAGSGTIIHKSSKFEKLS
jgi:hypothetical protein